MVAPLKHRWWTVGRQVPLHVEVAAFTAGDDADRRRGLMGYLQLGIGGRILVDGVTLRLTEDGRGALSFPARTDSRGCQHPFVRPVDQESRDGIELAVRGRLEELGIGWPGGT